MLQRILALFALLLIAGCGILTAAGISPQAYEMLRRARTHFERGNLIAAKDMLNRAKSLDPDSEQIFQFEADLSKKIKTEIEKLNLRGQHNLNAKNVPEATRLFRMVLALDPSNDFALSKMEQVGEIVEKIQNFKDSGVFIDTSTGRSFDVDLYSAVSYLNRARSFYANGDSESALELIENILAREPSYTPALELKNEIIEIQRVRDFVEQAKTTFQRGKMIESLAALDRLIDEMPNRHEFILMRAKANLHLKRYSDAISDIWRYYKFNPDIETLYPMLAEAYSGTKKHQLALGFAYHPDTKALLLQYRQMLQLYYRTYFFSMNLLSLLLLASPLIFYLTWRATDNLFNKLTPESLKLLLKCTFSMMIRPPEDSLGDLIIVARNLNFPPLNYLTGMLLFKIGQFDGALRFLSFASTQGSLNARSRYFSTLTRTYTNHRINDKDFEEPLLIGLANPKRGWHPKFIRKIERDILEKYARKPKDETFEALASSLIRCLTGENHEIKA